MEIKIKKTHPDARVPMYVHPTDAGLDLTAVSVILDEYGNFVYDTGLAFEIPEGYVGLLFPRSSNAKKNLYLTNSVGVIDSGYRGSVTFKYRAATNYLPFWQHLKVRFARLLKISVSYSNFVDAAPDKIYRIGDRVGQLIIMPYPAIVCMEADQLSETDRGEGGYGSTGR